MFKEQIQFKILTDLKKIWADTTFDGETKENYVDESIINPQAQIQQQNYN